MGRSAVHRTATTLNKVRKLWNAVSLVNGYWKLGELKKLILRFPNASLPELPITVDELTAESSQASKYLSIVGLPTIRDDSFAPAGEEGTIELHYDFLPMLDDGNIRSLLQRELNISEGALNSIKVLELCTFWSATFQNVSPALELDRRRGKHSNFAEAFPNLERISDDYQDKRLVSLGTVLEEGTQQSKEQIEVFGAKISAEVIPLVGLPILIVFLFQFSAVGFYGAGHVERIEEEHASQWSFMLRGWPFLLLSFGTIFVLPATASILSLWMFFKLPEGMLFPKSVYAVLISAVVICSLVAFISLERLRLRVLVGSVSENAADT
jgi:hypothetical protein